MLPLIPTVFRSERCDNEGLKAKFSVMCNKGSKTFEILNRKLERMFYCDLGLSKTAFKKWKRAAKSLHDNHSKPNIYKTDFELMLY